MCPPPFVHRKYAIRWGAIASACGHQDYGFSRASGLNDLETPLYPTAQTIAAPGLVDTDTSRLAAPAVPMLDEPGGLRGAPGNSGRPGAGLADAGLSDPRGDSRCWARGRRRSSQSRRVQACQTATAIRSTLETACQRILVGTSSQSQRPETVTTTTRMNSTTAWARFKRSVRVSRGGHSRRAVPRIHALRFHKWGPTVP